MTKRPVGVALLCSLALLAASCTGEGDDASITQTTNGGGSGEFAMVAEDVQCLEPLDVAAPLPDSAAVSEPTGSVGDGVLTLGGVISQTGSHAYLGAATLAAAELAVQDINAAGGVLGNEVAWVPGDAGGNGEVANQTVDGLLSADVDVVVGAAPADVSLTIIDKLTSSNTLYISTIDSSTVFTDYQDNGLAFQVAASDVDLSAALADLTVSDGAATAAFIVRSGAGTERLATFARAAYEAKRGCVLFEATYDPWADNFDAEVAAIAKADPDAIVIVGFDQTPTIVRSLTTVGLGAKDKAIYGVGSNLANGISADAATMAGVRGVRPGANVATSQDDFREQLDGVADGLTDYAYSAETYDAIVVVALASIVAGTADDGGAIGAEMGDVTRGGEKCDGFASCASLAESGTDFDYDGRSGTLEFTQAGEASESTVSVVAFDENGTLQVQG